MSSPLPRAFTRLGERFDRRYRQSILAGLAACLWFSVFASAAHDLWAACLVFAFLTALSIVLVIGYYRTRQSIQLPFIGPVLLVLGAYIVSSHYSYDFVTSQFECWVWFYSFVGFYLFINCARRPAELNSFFILSSAVLVPLALLCIYHQITAPVLDIGATLINSIILSGFALYWAFILWQRGFRGSNAISLVAVMVILLLGRSWWAGFSLAIGFMYYYKDVIKAAYFKRRSTFLIFAFLSLFACGVVLFFKFSLYQKHGYPDSNRIAWWIAALKMAVQHPLIGVGLGAYSTAYPYFHAGKGLNSLYAHNFPLQLLSETGLLGIAALLWLVRVISRRMQPHRVYSATLITVFSYSLIHINMEYFLNKIMFLFLVVPLIKLDKTDWKIQPGRWMVTGALGLVLLVPSWIVPWIASTHLVEGARYEESGEWSSARGSYQKATELDRAYGDAYAGLAGTYGRAYRDRPSAADLAEWRAYLTEAFRWKKSARILTELEHPPQ